MRCTDIWKILKKISKRLDQARQKDSSDIFFNKTVQKYSYFWSLQHANSNKIPLFDFEPILSVLSKSAAEVLFGCHFGLKLLPKTTIKLCPHPTFPRTSCLQKESIFDQNKRCDIAGLRRGSKEIFVYLKTRFGLSLLLYSTKVPHKN